MSPQEALPPLTPQQVARVVTLLNLAASAARSRVEPTRAETVIGGDE